MEQMQPTQEYNNVVPIYREISTELASDDNGLGKFSVSLPVFEGHFDNLLGMIENEALDICDISLSDVTGQYLQYLSLAQALNLSYASEFLLVASYLMEQKSKKLLPVEIEEPEVEEIETSLIDHVAQYRIFKKMAGFLGERKELFSRIFHKFRLEPAAQQQKQYFLKDVEVSDLVFAFKKIWAEVKDRKDSFEIVDEIITVDEKIKDISGMIAQAPATGLKFESLFKTKTRIEVIVTFLAMLELIRLKKISLKQDGVFGQMLIFSKDEMRQ